MFFKISINDTHYVTSSGDLVVIESNARFGAYNCRVYVDGRTFISPTQYVLQGESLLFSPFQIISLEFYFIIAVYVFRIFHFLSDIDQRQSVELPDLHISEEIDSEPSSFGIVYSPLDVVYRYGDSKAIAFDCVPSRR